MNTNPADNSLALALTVLLAPAAAALLLAVAAPLRRRAAIAAGVAIAAAVTSLISACLLLSPKTHLLISVPWLPSGGSPLGEIGVLLDGVSVSMLLVVTLVATCVQVFSVGYMHDEPQPAQGRYFALHSLFLLSMNILVLAPNLLQLFLGWELVGVTSYLLIGFYFKKPSAARAAVKAFWVTKFADMGLLMGLLVLRGQSGGFSFTATLPAAGAVLVTMLLFFAVVGKSAQFPLHVWLPDAMEGPTPVSALLHAATMVAAGVFLIVRAWPLFEQAEQTRHVMLYLGATTAVLAACMALVQTDIKRVLAYSTCSQLGYMIAALGAGSLMGGFFHLTTHAFFKALLFLGAGSVIHAVHSNELSDMGGLRRRMPITSLTFVIGSLSLAGVPGLAGFFSKDLVLEAVGEHGVSLPLLALLFTAFLTAFYMGRVVLLAFFGPSSHHGEHAHESGGWLLVPLLVLAVPALGAGFLASTFAELYGVHYAFHFGGMGAAGSGLAVAGLVGAFLVYGRGPREVAALAPLQALVRSAPFDRLYVALFHRLALPFAGVVGWVDRYLVDGVMNLSAWLPLVAGGRLRRVQTGVVNDYVLAVVVGVVALMAYGLWGALS